MKKLLVLLLLINIINMPNVYSDPTEYDEEQDILIEENVDNIDNNTDGINDIADNINDNWENINTNTSNIFSNNTGIITNIDNISTNRNLINNNSQRLDNHEGRINDLEETQFNVMGEVQFIRAKNHTISVYTKYDVRHNRVPEVGLKFTIGLGKSWTQEELERLEAKLTKIEKLLGQTAREVPIKTKMIKTKNGYSIVIDEADTVKFLKKF